MPGPNNFPTPISSNVKTSFFGIIPPPTSNTSSILFSFTPPAWAKSDLPPPPLPPTISEPVLTNFTASYLFVNLSVTPTAKPIFPSLIANTIIIPSPNSFLPISTSFLRSLGGKSITF